MPPVLVKLWCGRPEQHKTQLAEEIVKDVTSLLNCGRESASAAIEEVNPQDGAEKVYKTDMVGKSGKLETGMHNGKSGPGPAAPEHQPGTRAPYGIVRSS